MTLLRSGRHWLIQVTFQGTGVTINRFFRREPDTVLHEEGYAFLINDKEGNCYSLDAKVGKLPRTRYTVNNPKLLTDYMDKE